MNKTQQNALLAIAQTSIRHGLQYQKVLAVNHKDLDSRLKQQQASFVTLSLNQRLRGCIGTLTAYEPLANNVSRNAYNAAFNDHRFDAVDILEVNDLAIHISLLGESTLMCFSNQNDLLTQLQPGIDGLILREGDQCSTFLPSVWEQLEDPEQFIQQLKLKAGLSKDYWSESLTVARYTVESFGQSSL